MNSKGSKGPWRIAIAMVLALALGSALAMGCGDDEDDQENADQPTPCETNEDCADDEMCEDDICVDAECLTDEECGEAEMCEERRCVEDPVAIVEEDYFASFLNEKGAGTMERTYHFHVVGSRDGTHEEIEVPEFDCGEVRECALTDSMEHFIVIESVGTGSFDAYAAPFDRETFEIVDEFERFAESVSRPRVRGEGITYEVTDTAGHYRTVEGEDQELLPLSSGSDGWAFHAATETVVYYWPTGLDTLDVYANQLGDDDFLQDSVAFLDGRNRPGDAGSYFMGTRPTGFSDDGRFVAFTSYGPNHYDYCSNDADCTQGIAHRCGEGSGDESPRCTADEETVYVIDLEYREQLNAACTSHDDCGPVNRCDSGSEDFEGGVCAPQRIVLGPSDVYQQQTHACDWTREEATFTHANLPLTFGPDEKLYFVGYRDCTYEAGDANTHVEANIPRTAIVAADLETGEFEEIYGNTDREDLNVAGCDDDPGGPECNVVIQSAQLSPGGSDIVFRATVPTVGSPGQAHNTMDVWRVQRDGENPEVLGELSQIDSAESVTVHGLDDEEDDDNGDDENGDDENGEDDNGDDDNGNDDGEED